MGELDIEPQVTGFVGSMLKKEKGIDPYKPKPVVVQEQQNYEYQNAPPIVEQQQQYSNQNTQQYSTGVAYDEEMVRNSKLPESIKKAMIERPIILPDASVVTSKVRVSDLDEMKRFIQNDSGEREMPMNNRISGNVKPKNRQVINEQQQQQYYNNNNSLNEDEVRKIVDERMIELLSKYFITALSEDARSKVIQQLAESGKVTMTKKSKVIK